MRFSVQLDDFRGPLDLLLYLVRKHELDVVDIPLARVIDQYLEYIAVLEQIDVDAVGDFLDMASTLIEIKSRMVLPGEEEVDAGARRPAPRAGPPAAGVQAVPRRGQHARRAEPRMARAFPADGDRRARAADRAARAADPRSRAVGPGERVRPRAQGEARRPRARPTFATTTRRSTSSCSGSTRGCAARAAWRSPRSSTSAVHKSTLIGMFLAVLQLMRYQHARAVQPDAVRRNLARSGRRAAAGRDRGRRRIRARRGMARRRRCGGPFRCGGVRPRMSAVAAIASLRLEPPAARIAASRYVLHGQQSPGQDAQAPRPDDRRLLAGGRANLLAVSRAEARLRSGRPAVVVHGHRNVVRHARPPRPHRRAAGVRRAAADDEDEAAGDLPAGRD